MLVKLIFSRTWRLVQSATMKCVSRKDVIRVVKSTNLQLFFLPSSNIHLVLAKQSLRVNHACCATSESSKYPSLSVKVNALRGIFSDPRVSTTTTSKRKGSLRGLKHRVVLKDTVSWTRS